MNDERQSYRMEDLYSESVINEISTPKPPKIRGVYFLIYRQMIVYVGQSADVQARLVSHLASGKVFDSVAIIDTGERSDRNELEAAYIVKFEPLYNTSIPLNSAWGSASTVARMGKRAGRSAQDVRDYIAEHCIEDTNGYYLLDDFEELWRCTPS